MNKSVVLTFLKAYAPLTKSYALIDGEIQKTPYPSAYRFTSLSEEIRTIDGFAQSLRTHAAAGHCLIKGDLLHPLHDESRKGSTSNQTVTWWVCLDFDGLPAKHTIDKLLVELGLGDVSYVLQYSASYRIPADNDQIRCHVFMLLSTPTAPDQLRNWLVGLNLNTPFLRENTQLAGSKVTLKWGLDVTACQNDKLLYIASPELDGIPDPFKNKPRISVVKKKLSHLKLGKIPSPEANRTEQQKRVEELRTAEGLPGKKIATYKPMEGASQLVLTNPDEAYISGPLRVERGFVYMNLNGGDSWGYFHPEENADVIYNFKGEDPSLTSKLLPAYYMEAKAKAKIASKARLKEINTGVETEAATEDKPQGSLQYLAFKDKTTGTYKAGTYDPTTDTLDLDDQKSEKQLRDFCAQHGIFMGDFVPIWDLRFDPTSEKRIDAENRTVNEFQLSTLLKGPYKKIAACPPTIFKVIHHALGSDVAITEHFMNWCAFIVQKRKLTGTAWLLHGDEGTGKGVIYHHILRPLLGASNTTMNDVSELSRGFNGFLRNKLLVAWDEVHIGPRQDAEEMMGKLRNAITEPSISIRDLHRSAKPSVNFLNHLFFSNKRDAILLNTADRRYNIGKWQMTKLHLRHKEFEKGMFVAKTQHVLAKELPDFAAYLRSFKIDEDAASTVLETDERQLLIDTTSTTAEMVALHLSTKALMSFFIGELPTDTDKRNDMVRKELAAEFKRTLCTIMLRTIARLASTKRNKDTENSVISRDEAHTIFEYTVGSMPSSPTKFTQRLRHLHLEPAVVWIDKAVNGLKVNWQDAAKFPEYLKALGYKEKA